ncbi:MAG: TonB-dependent receptor [Bacteroidota bacterium]
MMKTRMKFLTLIFACLILFPCLGQELTQTIRGRIVDQDTQSPLTGVTITVIGSNPLLGSVSDIDGYFRLNKVPVGRVSLKISYIGYEERTISNLLVGSAKEIVLDLSLIESTEQLDEIVVTATQKGEILNEMSQISARSFSVEETKRFAGAIDDPARMVSAFAGVNNNAEGNNDIIVRGNSPRGILWRMEGIEIPNPNHFADEGATGGAISALNSKMLGNSDFFTGAFSPEYGNALSGVFDIRLRNGNNQTREHAAAISTLGLDLTSEGPLFQSNRGSYLVNYRYSTLDLIDRIGIMDFGGVPAYQDLSFKVLMPVGKSHSFSLFGLGGISSITSEDEDDEDENFIVGKGEMKSKMGVLGLTHTYLINSKAYLRNAVSASMTDLLSDWNLPNDNGEFYRADENDFRQSAITTSTTLNYKLYAKNKFETGIIFRSLGFNLVGSEYNFEEGFLEEDLADKGNTSTIQAFISWKHRLTEDITLINGLHYFRLNLNQNQSIEPRLSLKWQYSERQAFTVGFGIHSRLESTSTYLAKQYQRDGTYLTPNTDLDLSKAAHFVIGYDQTIGSNMHLKVEAYYQHLYDVPVEDVDTSTFSVLNLSQDYVTRTLTNEGTGRNYGIELTLERYFNKGFYFLSTLSLYKSLYTAMDGIERNTAFDGNYMFNFLAGKEFKIGKTEKNKIFFINGKIALNGGVRYTPVDLEASRAQGEEILKEHQPFSVKSDPILKADLAFGIRRNKKKTSTEFKVDLQNITGNDAVLDEYYIIASEKLMQSKQLPFFPTISYSLFF